MSNSIDVLYLPSSLIEFTVNDLKLLILHDNSFNGKIIPFTKDIIKYLQENKIDGSILSFMNCKQFCENVIKYFGNEKISCAAEQIWSRFISYQFYINSKQTFN